MHDVPPAVGYLARSEPMSERYYTGLGTPPLSFSKIKDAYPDVASRDVSALWILLTLHYHRVDIDQLWEIASVSVPDLAANLRGD